MRTSWALCCWIIQIFWLTHGLEPATNIAPMKISINKNADHIRARVRRYPPSQPNFLKKKDSRARRAWIYGEKHLESMGIGTAHYTEAMFAGKYRFAVSVRTINTRYTSMALPVCDFETELATLWSSKLFASLDLCSGHWQLPLDKESLEYQSFITPNGVHTPARMPCGQRNAVVYLQSKLNTNCGNDKMRNLLIWIYNILLLTEIIEKLMELLRLLFKLFWKHSLKIHGGDVIFFDVR